MNNISKHVTLVQLIDLLGNVNHALIVVGKWIYDSNYKIDLPLSIEHLNLICSCSEEEKLFELFDTVSYYVRYTNSKSKKGLMPMYLYICIKICIGNILVVLKKRLKLIAKQHP